MAGQRFFLTFFYAASLVLPVAACNQAKGTAGEVPPVTSPVTIDKIADLTGGSTADYLVVVSDTQFGAAVEYAKYRAATGYKPIVWTSSHLTGGGSSLIDAVHAAVKSSRDALPSDRPVYLLLAGKAPDVDIASVGKIPAIQCETDLDFCFTDNAYADVDGDGIPDVAVGRIPSFDGTELLGYLDKVKRFESTYNPGTWNRLLNMVLGSIGYGESIDKAIETLMFSHLSRLNHAFDIKGLYNSKTSPFYFIPFEKKAMQLLTEGSLAAIVFSHGSTESVDGISAAYLDGMECKNRVPFLFIFACTAGSYTEYRHKLAELMTMKDSGPITAFASYAQSHPFANAVLGFELSRNLLDKEADTIGAVMVGVKRDTVMNMNDPDRSEINGAGSKFGITRDDEKRLLRQHLDLYNLFGDPAIPINRPRTVASLKVLSGSVAGGRIEVEGVAPGVQEGTAIVTLESNRNVIIKELLNLPADTNQLEQVVAANWAAANDKSAARIEVRVALERFEAALEFPADMINGDYFVKVYAYGGSGDSFGSITVSKP